MNKDDVIITLEPGPHKTFAQQGDMIVVDFYPGRFAADPEVIRAFFPGRVARLTEDNRFWVGITCTPEEWQDFISFARHAVENDPDPTRTRDTLSIIGLFEEAYAIFRRRVETSPFKSPDELGQLVA